MAMTPMQYLQMRRKQYQQQKPKPEPKPSIPILRHARSGLARYEPAATPKPSVQKIAEKAKPGPGVIKTEITQEQYRGEQIKQQRDRFTNIFDSMRLSGKLAAQEKQFTQAEKGTTFYQSGQELSRERAISSIQQSKQDISTYRGQLLSQKPLPSPKGFDVIRRVQTPTGTRYEFEQTPEMARKTTLERGRSEYRKLSPVQQFGRALFAGATQFPILVYETVASPFTGKTQQQIKEDIALSEIGTYERLKKSPDPIRFAIEDVALSPAGIELGISVATMGIAYAAAPLARVAIRGGVRSYRAVSSFVPEESFVARVLSKGAVKIGSREPVGRALKYTFEGYRWGSSFVQKGVTPRFVSKPFLGIKEVSKKFVLKPSGRVFLSRGEQSFAMKELQRKLSAGYKFSPFRNALVKKSKTTLIYDISKKQWGSPVLESAGTSRGGYYSVLKKSSVPLLESKATGMRMYSKTGEFLGYKKPVLYQKPLPKKWIGSYRKPFLSSSSAQQTLAPQIQLPQYISKTKKISRGYGVTRGLSIPSKSLSSPFIYGMVRFGSSIAQRKLLFQMQQPKTVQESKRSLVSPSISVPVVGMKTDHAQVQTVAQVQYLSQVQTTKTAQVQKTIPMVKTISFPSNVSQKTFFKPPPMFIPSIGIYGGGTGGWGFDLWGRTKKYRERKTFNPFDVSFDWGF